MSNTDVLVLVVDDNPVVLRGVTSWLVEDGFRVLQADAGLVCLDISRACQPDLVLLDVNLPDIGGIEVCRRIKNHPAMHHMLVAHFSASPTSSEVMVAALEAGADAYLVHSTEKAEFLAQVRAMARIAAAEKSLRRMHDEMDERVAERTADMERANQALRAELAARQQTQDQLASRATEQEGTTITLRSEIVARKEVEDRLGARITEQERELQGLRTELTSRWQLQEQIGARAGELEAENQTLRTELSARQQMELQIGGRTGDLENANRMLRAELEQRTQAQEQLDGRAGTLERELVALQAEVASRQRSQELAVARAAEVDQMNEALHAQLNTLQEVQGQLGGHVGDLEHVVETLRGELADRQQAAEQAARRTADLERLNAALESEQASGLQLQARLGGRMGELEHELERLRAGHAAPVESGSSGLQPFELERINEALHAELETRTRSEARMGERSAELERELGTLRAETTSRQQAHAQASQRAAELERAAEALRLELTARQQMQEQSASRAGELERDADALRAQAIAREQAIEQAGLRVAEVERANEALRLELTARQQVQEQLTGRAGELERELGTVMDLAGARQQSDARAAELEHANETLRAEIVMRRQMQEQLGTRTNDLEQEIEALRLALEGAAVAHRGDDATRQQAQEQLAGRAGELEREIAALRAESATREHAQAEVAGRAAELERTNQTLRDEAAAVGQAREQAQQRAAELELALATLRSDFTAQQQAQTQLAERAAESERANVDLRAKQAAAVAEREELSARSAGLEHELAALRMDLITREQAHQALAAHAAELEQTGQALRDEAASGTQAREQAVQRAVELEQALGTLRAELAAGEEARKQMSGWTEELERELAALSAERATRAQAQTELAGRAAELERANEELQAAAAVALLVREQIVQRSVELEHAREQERAELAAQQQAEADLADRVTAAERANAALLAELAVGAAARGQLEGRAAGLESALAALREESAAHERRAAELRESGQRLRAILDSEPECVKLLARDGTLIEMNRAGLAMIEAESLDQVAGKSVLHMVAPEHCQAFQKLGERVFNGESGTLEFEMIGLRGARRWLQTHAVPLRDDAGNVVSLLGITRDFTERRQAEQERGRLGAILERTTDFVGITDAQHRPIYFNRAGRRQLGIAEDEDITKLDLSLFHTPESFERMCQEAVPAAERDGTWSGQVTWWSRDGREIPVSLVLLAHKTPEGVVEFFSTIARDETERHRAEAALRQSEELNRRILAAVPGGILRVAPDGAITQANALAGRLLGANAEELAKLTVVSLAERTLAEDGAALPATEHPVSQCLATGQSQPARTLGVRRPDGQVSWLICSALPLGPAQEGGAVVTFVDITARRQAEEALRRAEVRHRHLLQSVRAIVWSADAPSFCPTFVSQEAEALLGFPAARWVSEPQFWEEHLHPEDRERTVALCQTAANEGRGLELEYRMIAADGRVVWFQDIVRAVRENGGPQELVGVMVDITERKAAAAARRESEERYRAVVETAQDWLWEVDRLGRLVLCSPFVESVLGHAPEAMLGRTAGDYMHVEDRAAFERLVTACIADQCGWHGAVFRWQHQDGSFRWLESNAVPVLDARGELAGFRGAERDITKRKLAEAALHESEERFHQIAENFRDVLWMVDETGQRTLYINPAYETVWGRSCASLVERPESFLDLVVPEDLPVIEWMTACRAAGNFDAAEYRIRRLDGEVRWIRDRSFPIRDGAGRVCRHARIAEDITARKQAEAALRESVERFQLLARATNDAVWDWNVVTNETWWNESYYQLVGAEPGGVKPGFEAWSARIHPADRERVVSSLNGAVRQGRQIWADEYRFRMANGTYGYVYDRAYVLRDAAGKPVRVLGAAVDISARRQAEEELQKLNLQLEQRIAARTRELREANTELESFSYSVSHDLRAPLRAMEGFSQALLEDYAPRLDEQGRTFAANIAGAAEHMDALITDLFAYSRISRTEMVLKAVSLEEVIGVATMQLAAVIREKGARVDVAQPLPEVVGPPAILPQVVANLLGNALKFVAPGVTPHVQLRAERRGEWVRLWVQDNGIGIAPAHHARIFEVFERLHTTREYPGTGIGLAILRRAVERMGGRFGLESELGQGSRFWVELPAHENAPTT